MNIITIVWVLFGSFMFIALGIGSFFFWWSKVYKYRIRVFENVAGKGWEEVGNYRARKINIRNSLAEAVLYCPRLAKDYGSAYVSAYGKKMGKNTYWFFEGTDGWLYNVAVGDLDSVRGILDIDPIDRDVRGQHLLIQRNAQERYNAPANWPAIVMSIAIILSLVILGATTYINNKQVKENLETQNAAAEQYKEIASLNRELLSAYVNLKETPTGSGLIPVTPNG